MSFCEPCKAMLKQHKKAARRVAFLLVISIFLTALGAVSHPVNAPGFCRVYP